MKKFTKQLQHYLPLLGIFVAGFWGFSVFSYDKFFQAVITIAVATSYVFWGAVHHKIHGDLHLSVIVEYLVIAALGVMIVFTLLFRA